MLPNNIIKEQSISAANGGHSPCDELSIGLVSSSSSSRLGQTIALILPGSDTIISVSSYTMCDRSCDSFTSDFSQAWKSVTNAFPWLKILQIKSRFTFIGQKNTNAQSITIFILTFSLHEESPVDTMKGPGQEAATCQMTALVQCTSQLWSLSRSGPPNGLGSHHLRQAAAGCPPPAILSAG